MGCDVGSMGPSACGNVLGPMREMKEGNEMVDRHLNLKCSISGFRVGYGVGCS